MGASVEQYCLASGNKALFARPRVPFGFDYCVLVFDESQGQPGIDDQNEMLVLSLSLARQLALARFGDSERFMLIHNGPGARRKRGFHCHIIPVAGRMEKTLVYLWLFLKNVLHPVWLLTRSLRRRFIRRVVD